MTSIKKWVENCIADEWMIEMLKERGRPMMYELPSTWIIARIPCDTTLT